MHTASPSPLPLSTPGALASQIFVSASPLGRGSFGSVWRGTFSGSAVAVKICSVASHAADRNARTAAVHFRREAARYQQLRHPCITQFFCVVQHEKSHELLLVTELMRGGSLFDAISALRTGGVRALPSEAVLRMAKHVTSGLAYLHASDFSFGDLKTMNVLLSEPVDVEGGRIPTAAQAKLCDFGLSRNLKHLVSRDAPRRPRVDETCIAARNGPAGTFAYLAPEAFGGLPTDDADAPRRADIFALAVVLWELASLRSPWPGRGPLELIRLVQKEGKRMEWPEDVSHLPEGYVELVERCWHQDPTQRPSADEVSRVLEEMYNTLPPMEETGRWSCSRFPSRRKSVISRATEDTESETIETKDSVSDDFVEVDDEELVQTVDLPEQYKSATSRALHGAPPAAARSPFVSFNYDNAIVTVESFSQGQARARQPCVSMRRESQLKASHPASGMGSNPAHMTSSSMSSAGRTLGSVISSRSAEPVASPRHPLARKQPRVKSYTLPTYEDECERALELELQLLEDEEILNVRDSGVSMYTRPHFR